MFGKSFGSVSLCKTPQFTEECSSLSQKTPRLIILFFRTTNIDPTHPVYVKSHCVSFLPSPPPTCVFLVATTAPFYSPHLAVFFSILTLGRRASRPRRPPENPRRRDLLLPHRDTLLFAAHLFRGSWITGPPPEPLSESPSERGASLGGDFCVDLIRVEAIEELKDIADRMIRSGYEKECCQVYSNVRRDVLDDCLSILGMERHSIEEIQRIEWKILDEKAKKWILAVKVVVRVLLFGEKRLCEQVFNESELIQYICFVETTKGCVMQLLNFGEAVAIRERSSEKLFRILDMYEETLCLIICD
ncbi:hypothetical protein LXL04_017204 [Taraxacum kok-saghyz]